MKIFQTIHNILRTGSCIKNMIGLIKYQTTLLKRLSIALYAGRYKDSAVHHTTSLLFCDSTVPFHKNRSGTLRM